MFDVLPLGRLQGEYTLDIAISSKTLLVNNVVKVQKKREKFLQSLHFEKMHHLFQIQVESFLQKIRSELFAFRINIGHFCSGIKNVQDQKFQKEFYLFFIQFF